MNDEPEYLAELSQAQREAVLYDAGPALVIACAGSGKTRVLTAKILHLLDQGYAPDAIMALTFTNKAAREMRSRVAQRIGWTAARAVNMGTFHAIFKKILLQHGEEIGYENNITIYDASDAKNVLKLCIREMQLDDKVYRPEIVARRISMAKNQLISAEAYGESKDLIQHDIRSHIPKVHNIYLLYQARLKRLQAMDFDDLLFYTNVLLRDNPSALALWQQRTRYMLIDEYQDTNFAQYLIAYTLMGNKGKIFVVGDDSQSIYAFRGANIDNILHFRNTYVGAKLFKLEENYRSTRNIVNVSDRLISYNKGRIPKKTFSGRDLGESIAIKNNLSGDLEAAWLASAIKEIHLREGATYDTFAVLYRTNGQSRLIEQELRKQGIPFHVWGGDSFFSRREVKDTLAYFRLIVNPQDEDAFVRTINLPRRGIGDVTINKLRQHARATGLSLSEIVASPLPESLGIGKGIAAKLTDFENMMAEFRSASFGDLPAFADYVVKRSGLYDHFAADKSIEGIGRRENVLELLNSIMQYCESKREEEGDEEITLSRYLNDIILLTDQDLHRDSEETLRVALMTVHAAKGLEFPHVFVTGLEEQLFPSGMSTSPREIEEERRLLYVAITRAKDTCHISYASERFINGRYERRRPSRFLDEIGGEGVITDISVPYRSNHRESFRSGDKLPEFGDSPSVRRSVGYASALHTMGTGRTLKRIKPVENSLSESVEFEHNLQRNQVVMHNRFGRGTVIELEGEGANARADIEFDNVGRKKLLLRFAKLEPAD